MLQVTCLKAVFKCPLRRGVNYLIVMLGYFPGEGIPTYDPKNLGVLKAAKSGDFETVNCILIGQFLTYL